MCFKMIVKVKKSEKIHDVFYHIYITEVSQKTQSVYKQFNMNIVFL
jgi:hypothetical protein